jgi:hypothetical protein
MRVFVTKAFGRFARSERISDDRLLEAIGRADRGLVDAELGSGLIKQRVARPGQGRSGGYRTAIAFRRLDRAVFLYGFAKSERDNIADRDLARLKKLAAVFLAASLEDLASWRENCEVREVI